MQSGGQCRNDNQISFVENQIYLHTEYQSKSTIG